MSTPASPEQFSNFFLTWPDNSIKNRTKVIPPGSEWDIHKIGTFQVLQEPPRQARPLWLEAFYEEAEACVKGNNDMQLVLQLFKKD